MAKDGKKVATVKTNYGAFTAVFEHEQDMGGYVAIAPKVQGAVSWGKNLPEAKKMIAESIEGAIETRIIMEAVNKGSVRLTSLAKRIPALA